MKALWYAFKYRHIVLYYFLKGWAWYLFIPLICGTFMLLGWGYESLSGWSEFHITKSGHIDLWALSLGLMFIGLLVLIVLAIIVFVLIFLPILIGTSYKPIHGRDYRQDNPLYIITEELRQQQATSGFKQWIKKFQIQEDSNGILYRIPERLVRNLSNNSHQEPLLVVKVLNPTPLPDGTREEFYLTVPAKHDPPITTALEAVAWTFEKQGKDFRPKLRA